MLTLGRVGVAISALLLISASKGSETSSLRLIVDDLRNAKSSQEIEEHISAVTTRLDRLLVPVFSGNRSVSALREQIDSILRDEGGLRPRDITLVELASRGWICIAYNVPVLANGSVRRSVIRLWGNQHGTWQLSPLTESDEMFAPINAYPVKQMQILEHRRQPYLLVLGEKGHGMGAQAFSLWDLEGARCVWTRQLAYGDKAVASSSTNTVTLQITHTEQTDDHEITTTEIVETYDWQDRQLSLLSTTTREVGRSALELPPPRQ